ncbi:MAG: HEPN domain-containing protein [Deltaproteobacteria bacterium]|nr:HEPN domain-containing protein [Deltaproteobacteria bacterium]
MTDKTREWLKQAVYDAETAEYMIAGGRYFYAVFMCHLAVEKALKGCYYEKLGRVPPKVHNLVYLLNEMAIRPPGEIGRFIVRLNEANIATRHPESLEKVKAAYTGEAAREILSKAKEVLRWISDLL